MKKSDTIVIKKIKDNDNAPMDLLLLADPAIDLVRSYLEQGECYIAVKNDDTVGVILVMPTKANTIEVMNLAVKEEFQNKGIGKKLLLFVIDEIKKTDTKTIEIGTGNPGVVQMLLYQKCGFRIVGVDFDFFRRTHPEPIFENGIECRDMIRMRIDL